MLSSIAPEATNPWGGMCPQLQWPWGKLCLVSIEAHPGLKPAETAVLRDVVKAQSPYSPKPVPPPLGLSLGASLPDVLVWLLMSSLSLQRWSQTSCAVSARCCESWTGITPPASVTEVRRTRSTASGGQHLLCPGCCLAGVLLGPSPLPALLSQSVPG